MVCKRVPEYCAARRRKAPQASCVLITDQLTESIARRSNEYGIRHVLRKPFSFSKREEVIDQSLADGSEPESNLNGLFKRILFTRRLGLRADSPLSIEQSEQIAENRRNAERRLSPHRRHDDVPDGAERRAL